MQVQATLNYQPAAWREPASIPVRASTLEPVLRVLTQVLQELTQALPGPELTLAQEALPGP